MINETLTVNTAEREDEEKSAVPPDLPGAAAPAPSRKRNTEGG